ncbi:MAG TPA: CoA transferase [Eoetvoesiella sp.]
MTKRARSITASTWAALGGKPDALNKLEFTGNGDLPSTYAVTDLASATVATAALALADLVSCRTGAAPAVTVNRRLSSFWYASSIRPLGWALPSLRDSITGDYRTTDGWLRLHTNAPHHREAAERVLGCHGSHEDIAKAVSAWSKRELESAIVASGGCAAEMRSEAEWSLHPQGQAIAAEPLIHQTIQHPGIQANWEIPASKPLAGIRVLDLTRVLAGPAASRVLAGFGAEVLRIDPPDWNEDGVAPDVTLGKRCARLDLRTAQGRTSFEQLLSTADVLLHGYRPEALEALGYGAMKRRAFSPGLVDVCLNAYGWSGPWAGRRGFDSLVQMSSGIADAGQKWQQAGKPYPLPVQALDHATGYLMAAAAISGLARRVRSGCATQARLSLARTAKLLTDQGLIESSTDFALETSADWSPGIEKTTWGDARRLHPPMLVSGSPMHWALPASALGSARASWS